MMRVILLLLATIANCGAASASEDVNSAFLVGLRAYESGRYAEAVRVLEVVMKQQPHCARCANVLGKSYGRMAERAGKLEALGLVRKTRLALELAVELSPDDPQAISDLIRYYRAAPRFLGGSLEKARVLEQRLQSFDSEQRG